MDHTNSTTNVDTEEEQGVSWLTVPLAILGLVFSVSIVLIAIQYYIKKALLRDVASLAERKTEKEKSASNSLANVKFSRLETEAGETATDSLEKDEKSAEKSNETSSKIPSDTSSKKKEPPKDEATLQARGLSPPPAYSAEQPKSILKSNPAEVKMPSHLFPTDFLETILTANSTLVFPQAANMEEPKDLEEVSMEPLPLAQYTKYMRTFVHPSKERSGLAKARIFGEMLVASLGISAAHWESSTPLADLERVAVNWYGRMFSLPEDFLFSPEGMEMGRGGGCLTDDADESMLLALLAARTAKIDEALGSKEQHYLFGEKKMDEIHAEGDKISVYAKEKAFRHLEAISVTAGMNLRLVVDMTKEKLEDVIRGDMEMMGGRPGMIILGLNSKTLGHLEGIVTVAKKHNMWIHLDCDPAAARAWLASNSQPSFVSVDSIGISLSNMTALFVKDQIAFCRLFSKSEKPGKYNPTEWGIHERRRLKGLKMWFIFQLLGVEEFKKTLMPKSLRLSNSPMGKSAT